MALLLEAGQTIGAMIALCVLPLAYSRTRRVTFAVMAFAKRRAPRWLVPVLVACAFIPGPLDELLVLAAVAYPVLKSQANRAEFKSCVSGAWKGSK
jgi:hypothetical protein